MGAYDPAVGNRVIARPAICLNMIVRDEAHVVAELLDSVAPYISYWVIVDTGSNDGTQDLIRNHMARLGILGQLYERPWRNFADNRNEALALAQGHGDYILVIDADDTIVGTPEFTHLGADIYFMRFRVASGGASLIMWGQQLFRDGVPVRYEGATLERPVYDAPLVNERLKGEYHIEFRRIGARSRDPQLRVRDRDLLLAEIGHNPQDAQSILRLAQICFAAGDFVNARKWFERRVELAGPEEETYFAMYQFASSMANLDEPWPDVQDALLRAWHFRPIRAEPLYAIAVRHRAEKRYQLGYQFAKRAAEIPFPESELRVVNADVYCFRATEMQAVCAAKMGSVGEAFTLFRRVLARPDLPDDQRQRIARNRDACTPQLLRTTDYPDALVRRLDGGLNSSEVVVSLVAGPDRLCTERTLNSFLQCCNDVTQVGHFLAIDAGLSAQDRATLRESYGFLEFVDPEPGNGPGTYLAQIRTQVDGRFWLHLGRGWQFFAPENFITRLTAILDTEPQVFQVAINFTDAVTLTGTCAAEHAVRRAPDTGRYVPTEQVAYGPAMFDITRLDQAGGIDETDADPIDGLARRAAAAGLRTATLDEVLCIAAERQAD